MFNTRSSDVLTSQRRKRRWPRSMAMVPSRPQTLCWANQQPVLPARKTASPAYQQFWDRLRRANRFAARRGVRQRMGMWYGWKPPIPVLDAQGAVESYLKLGGAPQVEAEASQRARLNAINPPWPWTRMAPWWTPTTISGHLGLSPEDIGPPSPHVLRQPVCPVGRISTPLATTGTWGIFTGQIKRIAKDGSVRWLESQL